MAAAALLPPCVCLREQVVSMYQQLVAAKQRCEELEQLRQQHSGLTATLEAANDKVQQLEAKVAVGCWVRVGC